MHSLDNASAITTAVELVSDPVLEALLADRIHDWNATGLLGLTHLVIIEPGDTEEAVTAAIGFSPLTDPTDGVRFGEIGFVSPWDWYEEHFGWLELMMTIGNGGYAVFLMVKQADGLASELRSMCRAKIGL